MVKRYLFTEEKLREILRLAYNSGHVSHPRDSDELLESLMKDFPECAPREVPEWSEYFYGGDNAFMSPAGNDRYEEIPR